MKLELPKSKSGRFYVLPELLYDPHPYCIGNKHVQIAADHFSGMLSKEAIEYGEKHYNLQCGVRYCNLKMHEHKPVAAVACEVDFTKDEEAHQELKDYLKSLIQVFEDKEISGVAFVDRFSKKETSDEHETED